MNPNRLYSFATAAIAAATLAVSSHAGILLDGNEVQLETWLGQGDLDFTNIFTKQAGDDSHDFHAAVDGKGATFSLIQVYTKNLDTQVFDVGYLIGGYNPQSWNSDTGYSVTPNDSDRTAFIFNLTSSTLQRQTLTAEDADFLGFGKYQAYNYDFIGPVFGRGLFNDIYVNHELNYGTAERASYGSAAFGPNITGADGWGRTSYTVAGIEVYTVVPTGADVPDTTHVPDTAGTLGLLGISMLGLVVAYRRRFTLSFA